MPTCLGFGSTRRIVVYDNLLEQAPDDEIRNVVAHELGHASERDVLVGTLLGALGAAAAVIALFFLLSYSPLLGYAGVSGMGDGRVVALVLALVSVATLLFAPVQNLVSRRIEARADVHALDLTRDAETFTQMQRRLAMTAKADLTPNPVTFVWFGSHPSTAQRMAAARNWALANDEPVPPPLAPADNEAERSMSRVLVVTNDFPPRPGGIQTFVHELVRRLPPQDVIVYTSRWKGWQEFDRSQGFEVIREDTSVLLPSPRVAKRAVEIFRSRDCTSVLFGAAAPLGLMAPKFRAAGAERMVALTHGHEAGWAQLPGARQMLRRIGDGVDTVTYLGEYTRRRIARALSPKAASSMVRLTPGVDTDVFYPGAGDGIVRERYRLGDRPVIVCVSRLMPRKGQDTLIRVFPQVKRQIPDAALLMVGGGPYRKKLQKLAEASGHARDIILTGSVPWPELPAHYAAGNVFAMPCRTRRGGLDVEGLGIVYLEASATGLPVIAGNSGGAPDAVRDDETGFVVSSDDHARLARLCIGILEDTERARTVGERVLPGSIVSGLGPTK